jgi:multidrug efflux pump
MYAMLDDFHERAGKRLTAEKITAQLKSLFAERIRGGDVNILGAPPIDGLGTAGGFKIVIEDRTNLGLSSLEEATQKIVSEGADVAELRDIFTSFRAKTTWLDLDIDRDAVTSMGLSMADVFGALETNFGSRYVNDFNRFGRTWQVIVQAESKFRMQPEDLKQVYVPGAGGRMVPLSAIAKFRETSGPVMLSRYNLYSSAFVNADAAAGASSGEAIARLEQLAADSTGTHLKTEWTELAYLQQGVGQTAVVAFVLAVVLVFLVLAAQYESWSLPLAVILVVPMCLLCSVAGVVMARMDINIFTQIGFVVLVGLACKNAILIVEFARARHEAGVDRFTATLEACRLRLRPIIMTSLAFIFGVVPLMLGTGAGAEMRQTLGTAVFAGMLGVTLFGIFLTPVFFYVIQTLADWRAARRARWEAQ